LTSWRDSASAQAQADLDGLLGPALDVAQQQLSQRGEFYPYALAVSAEGEQEIVTADLEEDQPASSAVITALLATLSARRDQLRAMALVVDTRAPQLGGDAVRVTLEHREGAVMAVLLPYSRRRLRGSIQYGQLQATTADNYVW
jgi:hypothetical protein